MSAPDIDPATRALEKRCKRYRRMTFFSLVAIIALAFAPALHAQALPFALYGIALFGVLALAGNALLGYYARQLSAHRAVRVAH